MKPYDFQHLDGQEGDIDESQSFLENPVQRIGCKDARLWTLALISGVMNLLLLGSIFVILQQKPVAQIQCSQSSFDKGFETDFEPARAAIEVVQTSFTGGLEYDENGSLYRVINDTSLQYVGLPNENIDQAWKELMSGLEVVVQGHDADTVRGKTILEPDGQSYRLSTDVYHSLHCVNMVRQALDVDYYHRNGEHPRIYRIHTDHCLDYLRQAIQCNGDLTPLFYQYSEFRGRGFPVWGAKHTCRNFAKIHDWALSLHRDQPEGAPEHGGHHT